MSAKADPLDVAQIKRDFPLLSTMQDGKPIVYLDSSDGRDRQPVELLGEDVQATVEIVNVTLGSAVCFLCGNKFVHQLNRRA